MSNNYNAIKFARTGNGFKERLHVKRFSTANDMYGFLNKQDNSWKEATRPDTQELKSGIYAFAGGRWHNVKSLDPSVLAHV